jgi:glycosyltransferase involved in cell wall biosynthesis
VKFAIDCRRILPGMTGLGSYTLGLVTALAQLIAERRHELILFATPESVVMLSDIIEHVTIINVPWPVENHLRGDYWKHITLPRLLNRLKIDVFHDPAYQLPFLPSKAANVVTIHDLAPFRHPETNSVKYNLYWRYMTRAAVRRAERIIAVSEFAKGDMEAMFPAARGKVDVVPEGAAACFTKQKADMNILRSHGITKPYLLTAAKYEPRKNLARCIESFMAGPAMNYDDIQLVIAGAMGWKTGNMKSLLQDKAVLEKIVLTGYLEQTDLVEILRGALALVVPSIYEGFGLPLLEAMACGAPVISANTASLPEVGGHAPVYFDPYSVESMAEAMMRVVSDDQLRSDMILNGLDRAALFSWKDSAEKTLETYLRALKK